MLTTTEFAIGLAVSEDRLHSSLGVAGYTADGMLAVELTAYAEGPHGVLDALLQLRRDNSRTVLATALDPKSQSATMLTPLRDAGVSVVELGATALVVAFGELQDALRSRQLRAEPHPMLDAAAKSGTDRALVGGRALERRGQTVDMSPLDSVVIALWALRHAPKTPPFFASVRGRS